MLSVACARRIAAAHMCQAVAWWMIPQLVDTTTKWMHMVHCPLLDVLPQTLSYRSTAGHPKASPPSTDSANEEYSLWVAKQLDTISGK